MNSATGGGGGEQHATNHSPSPSLSQALPGTTTVFDQVLMNTNIQHPGFTTSGPPPAAVGQSSDGSSSFQQFTAATGLTVNPSATMMMNLNSNSFLQNNNNNNNNNTAAVTNSNQTTNNDFNAMLQSLQNQISRQNQVYQHNSIVDNNLGGRNHRDDTLSKVEVTPRSFPLEPQPGAQRQKPQPVPSNNRAAGKANSSGLGGTTATVAKKKNSSNSNSKKTSPPPFKPAKAANFEGGKTLYRDIDDFYLTEYQCLLRQQIELFEATISDVQASAQGRNSPIKVGQVGIRCVHCKMLHVKCRARGAVYFPRSIDGIYQVAQNLTKIHLCSGCSRVPESLKKKLLDLSKVNKRASGGKRYWNERVRELGIYEDGKELRFTVKKPTITLSSSTAA
jgi:hypothetical protein